MAKKTYRTYRLKGLQILLYNESGRSIEVNFNSGIQIDSTAKFTTNDEEVQQLLEKCSGFNRDFYIESVREESPAATSTVKGGENGSNGLDEGVGTVEKSGVQKVVVADKAAAIEWLKENHPEEGYTAVKLRTMAAVNEAGKKHGVVFEVSAE